MDTHHERCSRRSAVAVLADVDVGGGASLGYGLHFWRLVEENHGTSEFNHHTEGGGISYKGKQDPLPVSPYITNDCPYASTEVSLCKNAQSGSPCTGTRSTCASVCLQKNVQSCKNTMSLCNNTLSLCKNTLSATIHYTPTMSLYNYT